VVRIRKHGKDIINPVLREILKHQLNRLRVEVSSDDEICPGCESYRERSDTREHIKDFFVISGLSKKTLSFR
jgi:hypothetical protein